VLRNVSFHIGPGEHIAVVGRNGAGKTTLVKLLARLYDPTEGDILVDGRSLRDYELESWHRAIGVVFQDYARFFLTLHENIGFGDVDHLDDRQRVASAAARSGVDAIAERLPYGYDTYLARQFMGIGDDLSGGEWQMVALSRTHMSPRELLVLDEPTAALDAIAEQDMYRHFTEAMVGSAVLLVSHRFSTARMANRILVLEGGRLLDDGTHDGLIGRCDIYRTMFSAQASGYAS
jgi:ATP-binding cassette subfamily B protein